MGTCPAGSKSQTVPHRKLMSHLGLRGGSPGPCGLYTIPGSSPHRTKPVTQRSSEWEQASQPHGRRETQEAVSMPLSGVSVTDGHRGPAALGAGSLTLGEALTSLTGAGARRGAGGGGDVPGNFWQPGGGKDDVVCFTLNLA